MKKKSSYINRYEFISLVRQRWLQFLILILSALVLFAVLNGKQRVDQRLSDIQSAQEAVAEKDSIGVILLDSIEAGFTVNVPRWYMPDQPNVMGYSYLRVAAMPPDEMAIIATGQSDIYTHYVKPNMYGESFELNYTELSNPVQLMFGSFDLSFVLIYLLPLIVIAFTYNILSQEREQGILQVIASHPVSVFRWLLQKALMRYLLLSGILVVLLFAILSFAGVSLVEDIGKSLTFIFLTLGYLLFWFVLACLVNLKGQSSANNAVWLIAWWIFLVLLVPSSVNQMANSLYPVPSRAKLINELRVVNAHAEEKADELLEGFLRDHPELAGFEGGSVGWQEYFATQDLIKSEIQPVLDEYEIRLKQQQDWVDQIRFISPALLLQSSFNEISGTSTRHYEDYRQQVSDFALVWRDHFLPMIFRGEKFTKEMMPGLPEFEYQPPTSYRLTAANMLALFIYCAALFMVGAFWSSQTKTNLLTQ
ncbi:MAG: DUF3526 domain-containing protein [Cyclobacteriaceae bacterium]|nr:DUF3526 domain-containing protein [Cyclobacteriaceae bacterium]